MLKQVASVIVFLLHLSTLACGKEISPNVYKSSITKIQNRGKNIKFGNRKPSKIPYNHVVRNNDGEKLKIQKVDKPSPVIKKEKIKSTINRISNSLVDDFTEKPLLSTLKYVGTSLLSVKLASITINEIYNYFHYPSRMNPVYIAYLVENINKRPTKDELSDYHNKRFTGGVYNGDWNMKEKIIDQLVLILMTNYSIAPFNMAFNQCGYSVIDTFLFRNVRDRIEINSKRFLNNRGGDCLSIACYLLLFMEKLGVEARLAFSHFPNVPPGTPQYCHVSLVYQSGDEKKVWERMDLPLRFACEKANEQSLSKQYIGKHLLVLEKIKEQEDRKFTEMKCVKIDAKDSKLISSGDIQNTINNGHYDNKVPFLFNW